MELAEEADAQWAKQPYHAAEGLRSVEAQKVVQRGVAAARRLAVREMRAAVTRAREAKHEIVACAVLVGDRMPPWSVEEILAVHFRMHQAEGVLFRDALARAADACGLRLVAIPVKDWGHATLILPASQQNQCGMSPFCRPPYCLPFWSGAD
jgi:hypothetical protein